MTKKFLQSIAAEEIKECLQDAKAHDRTSLCKLYVNTAPQLTIADLLTAHEFWHRTITNTDGTPARCRKTGKLKTWKTRPQIFKLPVKHGLRNSFYLTPENIGEWCKAL